jgi:D-glycero-alpha-D-manno-heptose 1-phosphate guanylyltransferase
MKAVVLAGGFGTRLAHLTKDMPKPMAPVNNAPFLEYVLDHLVRCGVQEIVLAVSYKWEQIRDFFGERFKSVPLRYSVEEQPLGTGGAIRQALQHLQEQNVIVVNGDTLFPVDIHGMFDRHTGRGALLTMAVKQVPDAQRFGGLLIDEDNVVTAFLEKGAPGPGLINGGVYVINRDLFRIAEFPQRFSFESDLLEKKLPDIKPLAFVSDAYFIDIGVPEDYRRAEREVSFGKGSGTVP